MILDEKTCMLACVYLKMSLGSFADNDLIHFSIEPKKKFTNKSKAEFYGTYLNNLKTSELVILEGHHYLHWTESDTMRSYIESFLMNISNNKDGE